MGEVREMVKWIGGEAFAVISSKCQESVYVDPSMVIAVLGPAGPYAHHSDRRPTCNVYMTGGLNFTTYLSVEEISRALEEAKCCNYPPTTGVK